MICHVIRRVVIDARCHWPAYQQDRKGCAVDALNPFPNLIVLYRRFSTNRRVILWWLRLSTPVSCTLVV